MLGTGERRLQVRHLHEQRSGAHLPSYKNITEESNLSGPKTVHVSSKSLNCLEWKHDKEGLSNQIVCGGSGGALYLLTRDDETHNGSDEEWTAELIPNSPHSDQVRDIRAAPSTPKR